MSAQILELLFFAGIAFLIINKFISTLGMTNHDDVTKRSFFGEKNSNVKDVTPIFSSKNFKDAVFHEKKTNSNDATTDNYEDIIVGDNDNTQINDYISQIQQNLRSFDPRKFLTNAKAAFKMIIEGANSNSEDLKSLIDKRFLAQFDALANNYGNIQDISNLDAKISDIHKFGNNILIKLLFSGKNIVSNIDNFAEEWTFSRNLAQNSPNWYLTNIDRPH